MKKYVFRFLAALALVASGWANAQFSETQGEPAPMVEYSLTTNWVIHVDNSGVIRDTTNGQIMSAGEVQQRINQIGPILLGVLVGTGGGVLGGVVSGGNWGQIAAAGLLGGVGGYYGAVASMASGLGRALYGSYAAIYGGAGTSIVGQAPAGPGGSCLTETDSQNCLVKTK